MLHQPPPGGIKLMTGAEENRHYLRAFIQTYRDLPVLWDTSLRDYTNREKRAEAYQRLVPIYHYLKRDANVEDVKKKINTLRTNYRKELKVVEGAIRSGTVHTPRCWTFQELDFLRNTEKFLAVNPSFKSEPFSFSENSHSSFIDANAALQQAVAGGYPYRATATPNITEMFHKSFGHVQKVEMLPGPSGVSGNNANNVGAGTVGTHDNDYHTPKRARVLPNSNASVTTHTTDELLNIACDYLSGQYPEEESIARTWTHKLKRLQREQRLLAEKFINEILFEAESNNLHRGSVQVNNTFEPYVRYEEGQLKDSEEQEKSQSPSVHTSGEPKAASSMIETNSGSGGGGSSSTGNNNNNQNQTSAQSANDNFNAYN